MLVLVLEIDKRGWLVEMVVHARAEETSFAYEERYRDFVVGVDFSEALR